MTKSTVEHGLRRLAADIGSDSRDEMVKILHDNGIDLSSRITESLRNLCGRLKAVIAKRDQTIAKLRHAAKVNSRRRERLPIKLDPLPGHATCLNCKMQPHCGGTMTCTCWTRKDSE